MPWLILIPCFPPTCSFRDDVWMWHRVFVMAASCLSATLGPAEASWHMPYRLSSLFFEVLTHRVSHGLLSV